MWLVVQWWVIVIVLVSMQQPVEIMLAPLLGLLLAEGGR